LTEQQLPPGATLSVVSGAPFETTLRRCFEDAMAAGAKWTLTVDGDVLLATNAVAKLLELAEQMPEHYLQLEGHAFDKVLGCPRKVGHRVYRTALIPKVMTRLPPPGASMRPESATIKQVGQAGHPSRMVGEVVGLHDFEQSYRDLYRKAFTHAHKHRSRACQIIDRCAARQAEDQDFLVILKGVWDGLLSAEHVPLDASAFASGADAALAEIGIEDKCALALADEAASRHVDERLSSLLAGAAPPLLVPEDDPPEALGPLARIQRGYLYRLRKRGLIGGNAAALGAVLRALGSRLEQSR
jgi:hypothetical protein